MRSRDHQLNVASSFCGPPSYPRFMKDPLDPRIQKHSVIQIRNLTIKPQMHRGNWSMPIPPKVALQPTQHRTSLTRQDTSYLFKRHGQYNGIGHQLAQIRCYTPLCITLSYGLHTLLQQKLDTSALRRCRNLSIK